jgi:hypothetical protein
MILKDLKKYPFIINEIEYYRKVQDEVLYVSLEKLPDNTPLSGMIFFKDTLQGHDFWNLMDDNFEEFEKTYKYVYPDLFFII